jgi:hypothetical protein
MSLMKVNINLQQTRLLVKHLMPTYLSGFFSHKNAYCKMNGKKKIEEPQICTDCGKVMSSLGVLQRHIQQVHGNDKSNVCNHCGKGFAKSSLLKNHIEQVHSRKTCEHCGKSLLNGFYLKKHLVFDHGIKDGAFICDICPKTMFSTETAHKKHVKEKHHSLK